MRLILAAAIALTVAAGSASAQLSTASETSESTKVANLKLASVNGDTFDISKLKQPLVVLIAGTDSASEAAAQAVQKAYAAAVEPALFFGVVNAGMREAKAAADKWEVGYVILSDPGRKAMAWLKVETVPIVVFLNPAGRVIGIETKVTEASVVAGVRTLAKSEEKETTVDPVCGMTISKKTAAATYAYKGQPYYFCSKACKETFAKDPEKHLAK